MRIIDQGGLLEVISCLLNKLFAETFGADIVFLDGSHLVFSVCKCFNVAQLLIQILFEIFLGLVFVGWLVFR